MKMKFDFSGEEYADLHNENRQATVEMLHAGLDAAIDAIDDNVKCSITFDTDKE